MRTAVVNALETVRGLARKLGPYLLIEVLLPGGTLLALALFLYRRQPGAGDLASQALAAVATLFARVRAKFGSRASPPVLSCGRPNG